MGLDIFALVINPLLEGIKENVIDILASWLDVLLRLATTPFEFDWATTVMTYFQAFSIIVVFIIVIMRGIINGVLINGGSEDESVGHYLFESFVPIAVIAALPAIVGLILTFTTGMVDVFAGHITGQKIATDLVDKVCGVFGEGEGLLVRAICLIAVIYYLGSIALQCIKRWIQLVILSVISPLVAIFTATEDNGDFLSILRSMVAIGVITVVQLLLLQSVPNFADVGARIAGDPGTFEHQVGMCCFIIACLAATKQAPNWIERYTFASSTAGKGGVSHTIIAATRGLRGAGRTGGSAVTRTASVVGNRRIG